jgi:hypothetical protein
MKTAFLALGLVLSAQFVSAQTQVPTNLRDVMACIVPVQNGPSQVSMMVRVSTDNNGDFVVVSVNDRGLAYNLFSQLDRGEVASSITEGRLGILLLEETFRQDSGVIRNAGFAIISKGENNQFSGFVSAKSNIYPVNCTLR